MRALLVAVALGVIAAPARAQPSTTDTALATELFNAGRDLLKAGDYAAACPKLAESARLDPKVGTLARLAECEEHIGRLALARGHWQQALNLATSLNDPRARHASDELARIDRIVPRIEIALGGDAPRDLALKLDDAELGAASLGVKLPVDPGRHTIVVTAPGKKRTVVEIAVQADGATSRVVVPALVDEAEPPPPPKPAPAPIAPAPPRRDGAGPWPAIGLVTAGVGVVGLGVGAAFGLVAKSKRDESNAQPGGCNGNLCPPAAADARDAARSAGNLSTAFFVAGGALAAAGVTIWLLAPSAKRDVRVVASTGGLSIAGRW